MGCDTGEVRDGSGTGGCGTLAQIGRGQGGDAVERRGGEKTNTNEGGSAGERRGGSAVERRRGDKR
jgi:hypothetical protein